MEPVLVRWIQIWYSRGYVSLMLISERMETSQNKHDVENANEVAKTCYVYLILTI